MVGRGGGAQGRDRNIVELDHHASPFHYHYQQQHDAAASLLPRLSGLPFAISHLKFPSGFIPSCLFLNTTTSEKGDDCLSSHHVLTVCAASGAVYEAAIHIAS